MKFRKQSRIDTFYISVVMNYVYKWWYGAEGMSFTCFSPFECKY